MGGRSFAGDQSLMPGHAPNWLLAKIAKKKRRERNQSFVEKYEPRTGDRLFLRFYCDYVRILLRRKLWPRPETVYSDLYDVLRHGQSRRIVMVYFSSLEKLMACGDEKTSKWAESKMARAVEWRLTGGN